MCKKIYIYSKICLKLIPFLGWVVFDLKRAGLYFRLNPFYGWQVLTMNLVFHFFSYFSRSTIKRWKDLFTVWRAAARRWRCKRQTALRCLVSCLPFLNPFVNFFKFCWRTTAPLCFVVCTHRRLQLGSSIASWSFKLTFLGAKISPLRLCKYNMFFCFFLTNSFPPIVTQKAN